MMHINNKDSLREIPKLETQEMIFLSINLKGLLSYFEKLDPDYKIAEFRKMGLGEHLFISKESHDKFKNSSTSELLDESNDNIGLFCPLTIIREIEQKFIETHLKDLLNYFKKLDQTSKINQFRNMDLKAKLFFFEKLELADQISLFSDSLQNDNIGLYLPFELLEKVLKGIDQKEIEIFRQTLSITDKKQYSEFLQRKILLVCKETPLQKAIAIARQNQIDDEIAMDSGYNSAANYQSSRSHTVDADKIRNDHLNLLKKLNPTKERINFYNEEGESPLGSAIKSDNFYIADFLLNKGADIFLGKEERNINMLANNPLYLLAFSKNQQNLGKLLLNKLIENERTTNKNHRTTEETEFFSRIIKHINDAVDKNGKKLVNDGKGLGSLLKRDNVIYLSTILDSQTAKNIIEQFNKKPKRGIRLFTRISRTEIQESSKDLELSSDILAQKQSIIKDPSSSEASAPPAETQYEDTSTKISSNDNQPDDEIAIAKATTQELGEVIRPPSEQNENSEDVSQALYEEILAAAEPSAPPVYDEAIRQQPDQRENIDETVYSNEGRAIATAIGSHLLTTEAISQQPDQRENRGETVNSNEGSTIATAIGVPLPTEEVMHAINVEAFPKTPSHPVTLSHRESEENRSRSELTPMRLT